MQQLFRGVNDRITAAESGDGMYALVCECKDIGCFRVLEIPMAEWRELRAQADTFVIVLEHASRYPPHQVELRDRYAIVRMRLVA